VQADCDPIGTAREEHDFSRTGALAAGSRRHAREKRLCKQRVWFKVRRQLHLEPHHVRGIVGMFLAAFIALHRQEEINRRRWGECVRFAQWDLVPAEKILVIVEFAILADDNPAIII